MHTITKQNILRHLEALRQEQDTQSISSLQTVGVKINETNKHYGERKRSASAGLIRERQQRMSEKMKPPIDRDIINKKPKAVTKNNGRDKPSWNNNWNRKGIDT